MWKRPVFIFLALLVGWQIFGQQSDREAYIEKYKDIAIAEMERAGVPASIKLAQGLLESGAGTSTLAKRANNHFGMKCGARWEGKTFYREDDDYDENGKLIKSCFRVYRNADASFVAHSEFLRDPNKNFRYGFLFRLNPRDYKAWARGLKKAGYATSPTYATNLINIIERYQLYRYDRMLPGTIEDTGPPEDLALGIQRVNDVKLVLAVANETPADIALRTGVSISRILKYNERINDPNQALRKNERVYLQRKRSSYRGQKKFHFVRAGETMFSIAQRYGLRLDKLYRKNRMEEGSEPATGSQLKIRGWTRVKKAPALRSEVIPEGDPESPELEWEEEVEPETPGFEIDFNEPVIEIEEEVEAGGAELYHEVIKGETLFGLARRYGTTVEEIKTLNRLDSNIISVGQRLRVK
ncbi:MAG: glucosaminidase domain-containing protein [Bacteroidota bacterium]